MNKLLFSGGLILTLAGVAVAGWRTMAGSAHTAAALACSADGKTVYAADIDNIWKSEDAGKTWLKVTPKGE